MTVFCLNTTCQQNPPFLYVDNIKQLIHATPLHHPDYEIMKVMFLERMQHLRMNHGRNKLRKPENQDELIPVKYGRISEISCDVEEAAGSTITTLSRKMTKKFTTFGTSSLGFSSGKEIKYLENTIRRRHLILFNTVLVCVKFDNDDRGDFLPERITSKHIKWHRVKR